MHREEYPHIQAKLTFSFWDRVKILFGANTFLQFCHQIQISGVGKKRPEYGDLRLHSFDEVAIVTFKDIKDVETHTAYMKQPVIRPVITKRIDVAKMVSNNKKAHKQNPGRNK